MGSSSPKKRRVAFTNLPPSTPEGESSQRHQDNIKGREALIRSVGSKYGIKGYEHSPLEGDKAAEFSTRVADLQKKQNQDTETMQTDGHAKNEECQQKLQNLRGELTSVRLQKDNNRSQIVSDYFHIHLESCTHTFSLVGSPKEHERRRGKA